MHEWRILLIYLLLGTILKTATRQFFKEIQLGGAPLVLKGPVVIAANHPNQAVDPFIIGTVFDRPLYFLAKSTLFQNSILAAFFKALHMIPVYRKQDASDTAKNDEMFRAAVAMLQKEKAIVIFPEGTSREERQLLPLKTGAARLALQAQAKMQSATVHIQPVGITYLDPATFQTVVAVNVGAPIAMSTYMEQFATDPQGTVHEVTDYLEKTIRSLTVNIDDLEYQRLIENITLLFGSGDSVQETMQMITDQVTVLAPRHSDKRQSLEVRLEFYRQMISLFPRTHRKLDLFTALAFPFTLFGALINFIPYKATALLARAFIQDPCNLGSVKIGIGGIVFLCWFGALSLIAKVATGSLLIALLTFVFLIFLGVLTTRHIEAVWSRIISYFWVGTSPYAFLKDLERSLKKEIQTLAATAR